MADLEDEETVRRVRVELLEPGDIILTASSGKMSKAIRLTTRGEVSHAMICVQHGSIIDSTDYGVQAHNIQRELYTSQDDVWVYRLREAMTEIQLSKVIEFARAEIGTRYSKSEAVRSVVGVHKPRNRKLFCSRLVGRAFASAGVHLVVDPDYCTPENIRQSPMLVELQGMTEVVTPAELAQWAARPNPIAATQAAQNRILEIARLRDPSVENFNDLDRLVQEHPEWDEEIAQAYRDSGFLDLWRDDYRINPWHYDLAEMGTDPSDTGLVEYCVSTIREFHTGGLRYAVNLAHYQRNYAANGRRTTAQLVTLYEQLVRNDEIRREVALAWLQRHHPQEADRQLQRIIPYSEMWFSVVDRVEPRLGALARASIGVTGTLDTCCCCGDPGDDYRIVNAAEAMPGVPSLRLCTDCVGIRRNSGEILVPL